MSSTQYLLCFCWCSLVEFMSPEGAAEAVSSYNGVELMGRKIFIREVLRMPHCHRLPLILSDHSPDYPPSCRTAMGL